MSDKHLWIVTLAIATAVLFGAAGARASDLQTNRPGPVQIAQAQPRIVPQRAFSPAGPPPLNAVGPPPLNPAGPPPLNAVGPPPLNATGAQPMIVPRVIVSSVGVPSDGGFFCSVHQRAFSNEQQFLQHLALFDGIPPQQAGAVTFMDGSVVVFSGN
jgi:hypothetical protein